MCREEPGKYIVCKEYFLYLHSSNKSDSYAEGVLVSDGRISNMDSRRPPARCVYSQYIGPVPLCSSP
jgi:hypothetical protein